MLTYFWCNAIISQKSDVKEINTVLLDNTELYKIVWDKVYDQLHFQPDCSNRTHSFNTNMPFKIDNKFSVYGIEAMTDTHIDMINDIIRNIFIEVTAENERIYALDWQHSAFLFNPRNAEEQKSIRVKDERYSNGGYTAFFPAFYPDGDYCFFIDENFRFGYLGHPWRQEVWIFGELLVNRFEKKYHQLGWFKVK